MRTVIETKRALELHGGELIIADGLLACRGWSRLPADIQQAIGRHYYQLLVGLTAPGCPQPAVFADLRRWLNSGELETISDTLAASNSVRIAPGDAGLWVRYWLDTVDRYGFEDVNSGGAGRRAGVYLGGVHACCVAYWRRRAVTVR